MNRTANHAIPSGRKNSTTKWGAPAAGARRSSRDADYGRACDDVQRLLKGDNDVESLFRYWLTSESLTQFLRGDGGTWAWSMCETFHFIGLCLLVGIVGMFDLRVLGMAKGLPLVSLKRLLPWGVFGFVLCFITGLVFVLGMGANVFGESAYDVIVRNGYLQLKLIFVCLAGLNVLAFYLTGSARRVDTLGPGDDAPRLARVIAGTSLFLWLGVIILGRLISRAL